MRLALLFALLLACSDPTSRVTSCELTPAQNIAIIEGGGRIKYPGCLLEMVELDGPLRLVELLREKGAIADDPFLWRYRVDGQAWPSPERMRALLPFVDPESALLGAARVGLADEVRQRLSALTDSSDIVMLIRATIVGGCLACLDSLLARSADLEQHSYVAMTTALERHDLALADKLVPYAPLSLDYWRGSQQATAVFELAWPEMALSDTKTSEIDHVLRTASLDGTLLELLFARGGSRDPSLLRVSGAAGASRATLEELLGPELTESDRLRRAVAPADTTSIWLLPTDRSLVPDDLQLTTREGADESFLSQTVDVTKGATTWSFEMRITNTCEGLERGWICVPYFGGAFRVQLDAAPRELHAALHHGLAYKAREDAIWFEGSAVLPATGLAIDVGAAVHQTFAIRRLFGDRLVVWDRVLTESDAYEVAYGPCELLLPDRAATPGWQSLGDYHAVRAALGGCFALRSDMPGLVSGIATNPLLRAINDAIDRKSIAEAPPALLTTDAYSNALEPWRELGDWQREGTRHVRRAPALPRRAIESRATATCPSTTWTETSTDASQAVWCRTASVWGDGPRAHEVVFEAAPDDRAWIPAALARFDAELRPEDAIPMVDGLGARNRTYARIVATLRSRRYPPGLRANYAQLERDIAARDGAYGTRAPGVAKRVLVLADRQLDAMIRSGAKQPWWVEFNALEASGRAYVPAPVALEDAARGIEDAHVQRWLEVAAEPRLAFDPNGLIADLGLVAPSPEQVAALERRVSARGPAALRLEYLGALVHAVTLAAPSDVAARDRVIALIEAQLGPRARVDGATTRRWVARWRDALTRLDARLAWRLVRANADPEGDVVDREARRLIARWVALTADVTPDESMWAQALTTDPLTQVWFRRGDHPSLTSYVATLVPPTDAAWLGKFVGLQILGRDDAAEALAVEYVPPTEAAWQAVGRFVRGEPVAL